MNNSPSLVIGADSLIGKALIDRLTQFGEPLLGTTRRSETPSPDSLLLDLSQDLTDWVPPSPIAVAYLCAAMTSIDRCQQDPIGTARVNVQGAVILAKKLVDQGAFVIFLSSNAVYDGSVPFRNATDPTCPQTEYGRQKAVAEEKLLALGDRVAIVRLTKVFGPESRLIQNWANRLRQGEGIQPLTDLVTAPIAAAHTAHILYQLGQRQEPGIWQLSGQADASYAQLACELARQLQADPALVQPKSAEDAGLKLESIPKYTTLDTTRLQQTLGVFPPDIQTTLAFLLQEGL